MLDELHVQNLGIIATARVDLGPGLVVVTGETGTGKTLLLGALRLLMGETARRERIGPHGDELLVEARFLIDGAEHVAARRVGAGRSRAYLDGEMVTAADLGARTAGLVEVVGQHDHLALATAGGVRRIVDGALDADGKAAHAAYAEAWEHVSALHQEASLLGGDRRALERELDTVRFQADEIAQAGFARSDDEALLAEAERLRHHESIVRSLALAAAALGDEGAAGPLAGAADELRRAARVDAGLESLAAQVAALVELAGALATAAEEAADDDAGDPGRLDELEHRLELLGDLRRKYGPALADVLVFGEQAAARAAELTRLLDKAGRIDAEAAAAADVLATCGAALSVARGAAADRLAESARAHLTELGFRQPVVAFRLEPATPGPTGSDRVTLVFASDATLDPAPVSRVASGGELSRLVLALRLAAGIADVPIVAFDEIDAGVGGVTALALGRKLAELARGRQVLCVTHLPQVAAFADAHLVVERTESTAVVTEVDGEARLEELSRMLAGLPDSEKGKTHAAELLTEARSQ